MATVNPFLFSNTSGVNIATHDCRRIRKIVDTEWDGIISNRPLQDQEYWEIELVNNNPECAIHLGICAVPDGHLLSRKTNIAMTSSATCALTSYLAPAQQAWTLCCGNGYRYTNGIGSEFIASISTGEKVGFHWNKTNNGTLSVYRNGVLQGILFSGVQSTAQKKVYAYAALLNPGDVIDLKEKFSPANS